MNLCFCIGKIIGKIDFKFILNSKNISIAIFKIQLSNKSIITVKAYDEEADYIYRTLNENDIIAIEGKINSKTEIVIKKLH